MDRETLRLEFRPSNVKVLFIGESPPASGKFFYAADSGLYRAMRDAFSIACPSSKNGNFLQAFQSVGCYLVDLCPHPVDRLERTLRRDTCKANEDLLAREIAQQKPLAIASLLRAIEGNVARAASKAQWNGPFLRLPYPGRWSHHREAFLRALVPVLSELYGGETGIRTLDRVSPIHAFQACAFNHSAISPLKTFSE
jgi:hypothetical protein